MIANIMQAQWMWGRKGRLVDDDPKEESYSSATVWVVWSTR